ncbi:hypothetical protein H0H92_004985 [Tricholoma furcatifolium]|nr:hypothetical protein H0H92_004985 [Tricholoma furcatifolium]
MFPQESFLSEPFRVSLLPHAWLELIVPIEDALSYESPSGGSTKCESRKVCLLIYHSASLKASLHSSNPLPHDSESLEQSLDSKTYIWIETRPQQLIVRMTRSGGWRSMETLKRAATKLDGVSSFKLNARIKYDRKWPLPLNESFCTLGCSLQFLLTLNVDTSLLHDLEIALPTDSDLRYDPTTCPPLPFPSFAHLRHLTWAGHAAQLLSSWLPLYPALLANLETLNLRCNIAREDCAYILYHARRATKIKIDTIKQLSQVQPFLPLGAIPSHTIVTCLVEDLKIVSEADLAPLLEHFAFPSLRRLELCSYCSRTSSLYDIEALKWENFTSVTLLGVTGEGEKERIRTRLGASTTFKCLDSTVHYISDWDLERPEDPWLAW